MMSFLVSASIFGRAWQLFVRFLVLLANILVWCVRWDVLSVVRWALPKRSKGHPKNGDYLKTISRAEGIREKAQAALGATQLRLSKCRCKRDATTHFRSAAELGSEIAWLEQREKDQLENITKLVQALEQAKEAVGNLTPSGGVMQTGFLLLSDPSEALEQLAKTGYVPSPEEIAKRIGALVVDSQPTFMPQPSHVWCEDCNGTGKSKDSNWPCQTCYQYEAELDSAKRRIEALGWTVSREGNEWLATRGLRTARKLYIEELADLVAKENDDPSAFAVLEFEGWKINPAGGPKYSYLATRDGKQVIGESIHEVREKIESGRFDENYIVGQSSVIIYDDHPMYGYVRKYWPSWVELHHSPRKAHMAELDSDQSGRDGHCGLMFTLTAGVAAREFRNLWDDLCVKFKARAAIATGRASARHLPSELLKAGWSRNHTAETADGHSTCLDDPAAVAWNISGALCQALGVFSDQWQQYFKELAKLLQERHPDSDLEGDALVYRWNRSASGQEEVVAVAEEVERRLSPA